MELAICEVCSAPFTPRPWNVNRCCSRPCRNIYLNSLPRNVIPLEQRFWAKVEKTEGCWLWRGTVVSSTGYGCIMQSNPKKKWSAHRYSWVLHHGEIEGDLNVCHHCDVRICVRPDHLFLGTDADNFADMKAKGRSMTGDRNPSKWLPPSALRSPKNCKVDPEMVQEIRRRYAAGGVKMQELADEFGITLGTIHPLIRRKTWKDVP